MITLILVAALALVMLRLFAKLRRRGQELIIIVHAVDNASPVFLECIGQLDAFKVAAIRKQWFAMHIGMEPNG